jgi:hypothetical protein
MRSNMKKSVVAAAVTAASLGVIGGTAIAEPESAAEWSMSHASWNDPNDAGGISIYEKASKTTADEFVMGQFIAYGETLTLWDEHENGKPAILKLWVGGSGPAIFYAEGDNTTREIPRSYDEGQTVYLQVCTSDSPNAVCSPKKEKGRT